MQKLLIDIHCGGLTPTSSWTPIQLFDYSLQWDGRELEEQKWEKFMGGDKDSLKSKENQNLIKKAPSDAKAITHHLPRADPHPASPTVKVTVGELSAANFIAQHHAVWHGIALWPVQISCSSAAPSQLLAHVRTRWKAEKAFSLCALIRESKNIGDICRVLVTV